ncbi:hypothetical protein [Streptomyces sp. SID12501]|uniref:Tetratricopeptide repeat protein n=1 Tax=Streptomyces sp. SID12501 TaxID=2706042 RepID=A0A6B3BZU8_9ACTN|nr:hypothetical protein [Streptomyces sp. SID12501]NEC89660.1 hypothetical protein [Streptomyces sp. SID12501]
MDRQLQPNHTLRRLMAEYGFTREGLAEAVNNAAERESGGPGNCGARLVGYWLSGKTTWPRTGTRGLLEAVFRRPVEELGFRPPVTGRVRVTVRESVSVPSQDPPVLRRKFVIGLGSLVALPVLPESGRLGVKDIEHIHATETQLLRLDDQYGSEQLAGVSAHYIGHIERTMRQCSYGGRIQTELHRTLGNMCAVAGWFCYDSARHEGARRWWDTGLRYALLARDPLLQARVWSYMSRQAVDLGHGSEAVAIARAALDATRGRREAYLSALLHTRVALGLAAVGEATRSFQSLHRAEQEIDRTEADAQPWLSFVGPAEVLAQGALCQDQLGAYDLAVELRRQASDLRGTAFRRNRFSDRVHLAECLLAGGEHDEAISVGHQALSLLPEVRTPRWNTHLSVFGHNVLQMRVPGATEFADHYREATA